MDKKITPEIVKKIELSLEERKQKRDRRDSPETDKLPPGIERRKGDRRKPGE
jgi:hypothetical protein